MTNRNIAATWASTRVIIDFTRAGWHSFEKVNKALGARFIRPFVLRNELAAYIAAHEAQGHHFDTEGEELRYDGGVYVVIRKMQGVWYIIDAYMTETPAEFEPILLAAHSTRRQLRPGEAGHRLARHQDPCCEQTRLN